MLTMFMHSFNSIFKRNESNSKVLIGLDCDHSNDEKKMIQVTIYIPKIIYSAELLAV